MRDFVWVTIKARPLPEDTANCSMEMEQPVGGLAGCTFTSADIWAGLRPSQYLEPTCDIAACIKMTIGVLISSDHNLILQGETVSETLLGGRGK